MTVPSGSGHISLLLILLAAAGAYFFQRLSKVPLLPPDGFPETPTGAGAPEPPAPAARDAWERPQREVIRAAAGRLRGVGPPRYGAARGEVWENPAITVYPDGLDVRAPGSPAISRTTLIPLRDLPDVLAGMLRAAWPYGGWISLAPSSLGSGDDFEESLRRAEDVAALLEELGLVVIQPGL